MPNQVKKKVEQEWFSGADAIRYTGIGKTLFYRLVDQGRIKGSRPWPSANKRFRRGHLDKVMQGAR